MCPQALRIVSDGKNFKVQTLHIGEYKDETYEILPYKGWLKCLIKCDIITRVKHVSVENWTDYYDSIGYAYNTGCSGLGASVIKPVFFNSKEKAIKYIKDTWGEQGLNVLKKPSIEWKEV